MTPLHEHRHRNADESGLREVERQIEQDRVEFVYYQSVTLTGRIVAKVVPARHLRRNAERTADRLTTYRMICRQVARELGVTASFMPKPATGVMGNGCHHNFSLWHGAENVLAEPGRTELHLSATGRHALAGVLTHAAGRWPSWARR